MHFLLKTKKKRCDGVRGAERASSPGLCTMIVQPGELELEVELEVDSGRPREVRWGGDAAVTVTARDERR